MMITEQIFKKDGTNVIRERELTEQEIENVEAAANDETGAGED